ncbi:hypothetical protein [Carnobacterium pleistocenium]|uniref:hypothetical protein n=1 Tax=Carnobacterium pleistocenium TaxID=181073 RepID=UPI000689B582|nr:hypothetical protein [Carnobacterium pleistocenium]
MEQDEQLEDWYVRYHSIFGKRYTRKRKDRFLESLSADIHQFRSDVALETFKVNEKDLVEYKNLYVGNIKKADTIICTYYDTPAAHLGPYQFFDVANRTKNTMRFIFVSAILTIMMGLLFTWQVAMPIFQTNSLLSLLSLLCILFYALYFFFLKNVARGWPNKHNLIRNTSSVLVQLYSTKQFENKKLAFAFLDAGCTNNAGLEKVLRQSNAVIYMLDSIGSEKNLYQVMSNRKLAIPSDSVETVVSPDLANDRLVYVISGTKENEHFTLSKDDLKQHQLSDTNMNEVLLFLKQLVGRNNK